MERFSNHRCRYVAAASPAAHTRRRRRRPLPLACWLQAARGCCPAMVTVDEDRGDCMPPARAAGHRGGLTPYVLVVAAVAASSGLQFGYNLVGATIDVPQKLAGR